MNNQIKTGEDSKWYEDSKELGKSFFSSWSILSAGTFTLLIPFIQSLQGNIKSKLILLILEILLLVSLITSSLHPFIASQISLYNAFPNLRTKSYKFYVIYQRINHILSITSYLIAIILLLIFVNINLF